MGCSQNYVNTKIKVPLSKTQSQRIEEVKIVESQEINKNIIQESNRIDQAQFDPNKIRRKVDIPTASKVSKCVCKIIINENEGTKAGTGFFLIYKEAKYLITCYHIINSEDKNYKIEIYNKKEFNLQLKNHFVLLLKEPLDISVIEINENDEFINYIDFLDYDLNYINGYDHYKGLEIYILGYPKGLDSITESGIIISISNYEFYYDVNTEAGSSGSPILLFNINKIIGIHKQADLAKELNVGTFINIIFEKIDDAKVNNKDIQRKINDKNIILDIEIMDKYICAINYNMPKEKYKDLGFFVNIPNKNKSSSIKGLLTKFYIDESILGYIKEINIFNNGNLMLNLDSEYLENIFIFSDEFLNISFIELKNCDFDYIDIFDGDKNDKIPDTINLIKYSKEINACNNVYGNSVEKWGVFLIYHELDDLLYMNYKSTSTTSGLIINDKLFGIYKQNIFKNEIATNIDAICKAIELNYNERNNIKNSVYFYKPKKQHILNEEEINELKNIGLELTDIPNILVSPPAFITTPIWFYRTKHAWYWTPTRPDKDNINRSNWMIISPKNSVKAIGGIYNGQKPAPKNIDLIHFLEASKLKYL
jgi:V8-like Glu-specific endopeptidase